MIRSPGPGRIENRTVDGSANAYLAATAILAAGLDGIENRIPAGKRNDHNLYEISPAELERTGLESLPSTLDEALDALEDDPVVMGALGSPYAEYYVRVKRDEWKEYHDSVSRWEVDRYL